jgi:hypothetical protein
MFSREDDVLGVFKEGVVGDVLVYQRPFQGQTDYGRPVSLIFVLVSARCSVVIKLW